MAKPIMVEFGKALKAWVDFERGLQGMPNHLAKEIPLDKWPWHMINLSHNPTNPIAKPKPTRILSVNPHLIHP